MIYNRLTRSYENMRNENEKSFAEEGKKVRIEILKIYLMLIINIIEDENLYSLSFIYYRE